MQFDDFGLAEPIRRAIHAEGYTVPTPIQAKAIPHIMQGHDILGTAQTGTGKTAAFALPILHRLAPAPRPAPSAVPEAGVVAAAGAVATVPAPPVHHTHRAPRPHRNIRVLVLSPTRELASQIEDSFRTYGAGLGLRTAVIFGGVGQGNQVRALHTGVDIVVATPGRLLDLKNQGHVDLRHLEVFVLDEADRMLDMGFIHDIRKIVGTLPPAVNKDGVKTRQSLFFSATMPPDIRRLADAMLSAPVRVEVAPVSSTAERIDQAVFHLSRKQKPALLTHLLRTEATGRVLVFTRTKHGADRVVKDLHHSGIASAAIHGNKRQTHREKALHEFRSGKAPVLVATDIAARGIDIDEISHVINFDVPNVPETYIHRIGRTARAGASGVAISFCDAEERPWLKSIERLTRRPIPVRDDHPDYSTLTDVRAPADERAERPERGAPRSQQGRRGAAPGGGARRGGPGQGGPGQGGAGQGGTGQGGQFRGGPGQGGPGQFNGGPNGRPLQARPAAGPRPMTEPKPRPQPRQDGAPAQGGDRRPLASQRPARPVNGFNRPNGPRPRGRQAV